MAYIHKWVVVWGSRESRVGNERDRVIDGVERERGEEEGKEEDRQTDKIDIWINRPIDGWMD